MGDSFEQGLAEKGQQTHKRDRAKHVAEHGDEFHCLQGHEGTDIPLVTNQKYERLLEKYGTQERIIDAQNELIMRMIKLIRACERMNNDKKGDR